MFELLSYYLISHFISFTCSIFEAVLLCSTPSYVSLLKKRGSKTGYYLEELKSRIDKPLAGILTLNTIAHTVGAAVVGAKVVEVFGEQYLALASAILTLTMLYVTEMIPKTIGALYWKSLTKFCVYPVMAMTWITYPFVIVFNFLVRILFGEKKADKITEEEIRISLEAGRKAGVIEETEQDMMENIFRLGDRRVGVLMSPRLDIKWLDVNDPMETSTQEIGASPHHFFPVCEGDINKVIGVVDARALLVKLLAREKVDLRKMSTPPLFVQENQKIFELLELFKRSSLSLALVTDEYGSIQGLITMSDILSSIVKDVGMEGERITPQVIKVNSRSYLIDGKMPIDEFKEMFHIELLPDEERARYRTVGGLCMNQLGVIPRQGDIFAFGNLHIEVVKVRRRRVETILLTKLD